MRWVRTDKSGETLGREDPKSKLGVWLVSQIQKGSSLMHKVEKETKGRGVGLRSDTGPTHHSPEQRGGARGGVRAVLAVSTPLGVLGPRRSDEDLSSAMAEVGCGEWVRGEWAGVKEEGQRPLAA